MFLTLIYIIGEDKNCGQTELFQPGFNKLLEILYNSILQIRFRHWLLIIQKNCSSSTKKWMYSIS
jgi:hypothetical protein